MAALVKYFFIIFVLVSYNMPRILFADKGVTDLRLSTASIKSDWSPKEIISAWLKSRIPKGVKRISPEELRAKQIRKDKFILIDARHRAAYEKKHIVSAISVLIWKDPVKDRININLSLDTEIVVYCQRFCKASARVLDELWDKGYRKLRYLGIGPKEWEKLGYPVVSRDK